MDRAVRLVDNWDSIYLKSTMCGIEPRLSDEENSICIGLPQSNGGSLCPFVVTNTVKKGQTLLRLHPLNQSHQK